MAQKPYNTLAFIGRFQPFHHGHQMVVTQALKRADKVALVMGSHDQPRSPRNPFTTADRIEMITAVFPQEVADRRIQFVPQVDHTYNLDRWIAGVQSGVGTVVHHPWTAGPSKVGLIGHAKDNSSFYLKSFPTWGSVDVPGISDLNGATINATAMRELFLDTGETTWNVYVPPGVRAWLDEFSCTDEYLFLKAEREFLRKHNEIWAGSPYPPTFNTVDAVVVQSGHVLLIRRRAAPGKGLWALPGGYINVHEKLKDSMLRELREETRIDVPLPVLRGSIVSKRMFDDPHRSQRGRIITMAYYIRLSDREELPKVKGSDDADKARWVPLADVRRDQMFEDHYDIIETMVSI